MTIFPGIILADGGNGIRIKLTRRVDLAPRQRGFVGAVETPSIAFAKKLRRVLEQIFLEPGSGAFLTVDQVADVLTRCRRFGLKLVAAPVERTIGPISPVVEKRYVPDPSMSRAELLHQLEAYPNSRWIGHVKREVSMTTLIGGLARVRGRTEAQTKGAEHFRKVAEQSMLGASKAIDYGQVRVDSSGQTADAVAEANADARRDYDNARRRLDKKGLKMIAELMIVQGQSIREVAHTMGISQGGTSREKISKMALLAADELAAEFGYVGGRDRPAKPRPWSDGSKAVVKRDEAA